MPDGDYLGFKKTSIQELQISNMNKPNKIIARIKTQISNLVRTYRFQNNLDQVPSKSKDQKAKQFKISGAIKPKSAKVTYAVWQEKLSFINNYIIQKL